MIGNRNLDKMRATRSENAQWLLKEMGLEDLSGASGSLVDMAK